MFGSTTQSSTTPSFGGFGSTNNTNSSSLFGAKPNTTTAGTTGGGLFGSSTNQQQQPASGGLFGAKPATGTTTGGGLFGSQQLTNTTTGGGLLDPKITNNKVVDYLEVVNNSKPIKHQILVEVGYLEEDNNNSRQIKPQIPVEVGYLVLNQLILIPLVEADYLEVKIILLIQHQLAEDYLVTNLQEVDFLVSNKILQILPILE